MVLSDKADSDSLVVLDKLEMNEFKTKVFDGMLTGLERKAFKIKQVDSKATKQESKKTKKQENQSEAF